MANTYISRTHSGTATDTKKITYSAWLKFGTDDSTEAILVEWLDGNYRVEFLRLDTGEIRFEWIDSGNNSAYFKTVRKFRDVNAWYHFVFTLDTTLATAGDRIKLYINGVRETEFDSSYGTMNPTLNKACRMNENGKTVYMGQRGNSAQYWTGSMSHIHFVDGTAYQADTFGSTDSTTGEWKINTSPTVTYGNHGWFILKDGNSVTDQSGNGNNCTASGTLTKTEDNPSNVFCTLNPLATGNSAPTFSKGNNRVTANATNYQFSCGTIAVPLTGKWYWEVKANDNVNGSSTEYLIGAVLESRLEASGNFAEFAADGITQYGSVGTGIGQNDIIGVSVDRTAATLKIYKNNSLILTKSSLPAELIYPMVTVYGSVSADANFGNGYFGGTAVSSAGTNASNNGIFEYDVIPSDANALSTKGLNL